MRTIQIHKPKATKTRPDPDLRTPSGRILPY
jgi:hypothetical protein